MDDRIENIIEGEAGEQKWFICCKCPVCHAIFTISMDSNPRNYAWYYVPCPVCNVTRNWISNQISKAGFKFRRWWRQIKKQDKGDM